MIDILLHAAEQAALTIKKLKASGFQKIAKGGRDFLTDADKASQDVILTILSKELPNVPVVAEEQEEHRISWDTFLTVDPIDGTYSFAGGVPDWSILIGYVEKGAPQAGVLSQPDRNVLIQAERGKGCQLNGTRVKLAPPPPLKDSILGLDAGWWSGKKILRGKMVPLMLRSQGVRCVMGAGASTAEVIQGFTRAYFQPHGAKVWDFAPTAIAIEEAGGITTNVQGDPLRWDQIYMDAIFAASEPLLREIVDVFK